MVSGQKLFHAKHFDGFAAECVCLKGRKEGISHKRDELKIQEQSSRELTGDPELYVGVLFIVRVKAEYLQPSEICCKLQSGLEGSASGNEWLVNIATW